MAFGDVPSDVQRSADEIRRLMRVAAANARFSTQRMRDLVTQFTRPAIAAALAPDGAALLTLYNELETFRADYDGVSPIALP